METMSKANSYESVLLVKRVSERMVNDRVVRDIACSKPM
jgi:hypothetical protein